MFIGNELPVKVKQRLFAVDLLKDFVLPKPKNNSCR